jgi:asparagine synthase (glutamine-hydrolysing)
MPPRGVLPGFLAVAGDPPAELADRLGVPVEGDAVRVARWGTPPVASAPSVQILSRVVRRTDGAVPDAEVAESMLADPGRLTTLLPPFAAVAADGEGAAMVADSMGFRQLFHTEPGAAGAAVLSTSALLAGWARGAELDHAGVAAQSLLGWQLGDRTLHDGVRKLAAGAEARLDAGGVRITPGEPGSTDPLSLEGAVAQTVTLLRTSLEALLDDQPDAVLQLTGGLDSRLLLSAIPVARRRGLRAMTLGVPGSGDVAIASGISARYGIRHEVHGLADLDGVTPEEAWELCRDAALRLDGMSDPVALAALGVAERGFAQGVRISGLGGEVARGFYYVGRVRDRSYTRKDAEQLAAWRMFVNEAVEPGLLTGTFSDWARESANAAVYDALRAGGDEWFRATDELYLRHRMQRWAGATDTAVGYQRIVVNPMLDHGFLELSSRLAPQDKANSRFLAALQVALDPELADLPLEGRPSPATYAHPSAWEPMLRTLRTGKRLGRKAVQRLRRGNRPPAGGEVLAARVVTWWREHPSELTPLSHLGFVEDAWVEGVLSGAIEPRPSSVGFLTNLLVAVTPGARAPR